VAVRDAGAETIGDNCFQSARLARYDAPFSTTV